jgi:hypothetical protein
MIAWFRQPKLLAKLLRFKSLLKPSEGFDKIFSAVDSTIRWKYYEWVRTNFRDLDEWGQPIYDPKVWAITDKFRSNLAKKAQDWREDELFLDSLGIKGPTSYLGKLGLKQEAAGKIRVFAMVDPFTQWVMNPLHKFLFKKLSKIPMDGTFDQLKPLNKVPFGTKPLYSFDLSAATDRLPISLQKKILSHCFGEEFSSLWGDLLVGRSYQLQDLEWCLLNNATSVKYAVGQPMGALSSWAMLALTHHLIVQCAYWILHPNSKELFQDYAVLGDDIVIWNKRVALSYHRIVTGLGVEVGLAKSIISPAGTALEFAKKTIWKGKDVSPIPLLEYSAALETTAAFIHFCKKYEAQEPFIKSCLGLGYKSSPNALK